MTLNTGRGPKLKKNKTNVLVAGGGSFTAHVIKVDKTNKQWYHKGGSCGILLTPCINEIITSL